MNQLLFLDVEFLVCIHISEQFSLYICGIVYCIIGKLLVFCFIDSHQGSCYSPGIVQQEFLEEHLGLTSILQFPLHCLITEVLFIYYYFLSLQPLFVGGGCLVNCCACLLQFIPPNETSQGSSHIDSKSNSFTKEVTCSHILLF